VISITDVSIETVVRVLSRPRTADSDEFGTEDHRQALAHVAGKSDFLRGVWRDNDLLAVFGAYRSSFLSKQGTIWFLGTPNLDENPVLLLRPTKEEIPRIRSEFGYDKLVAWVFRRNELSRRWMEWLGFRVYDEDTNYLYAEYV
jgi:hypothetical protein